MLHLFFEVLLLDGIDYKGRVIRVRRRQPRKPSVGKQLAPQFKPRGAKRKAGSQAQAEAGRPRSGHVILIEHERTSCGVWLTCASNMAMSHWQLFRIKLRSQRIRRTGVRTVKKWKQEKFNWPTTAATPGCGWSQENQETEEDAEQLKRSDPNAVAHMATNSHANMTGQEANRSTVQWHKYN